MAMTAMRFVEMREDADTIGESHIHQDCRCCFTKEHL